MTCLSMGFFSFSWVLHIFSLTGLLFFGGFFVCLFVWLVFFFFFLVLAFAFVFLQFVFETEGEHKVGWVGRCGGSERS